MAFLLVATLGYSQSLIAGMRLADTTRERALATQAARQILEELQDEDFGDVFALYNESAGDDPQGPGSGPGSTFDVEGLRPEPDDPDGRVGEIVFPVIGSQLREDADLPALGTPVDMNANGIDSVDHALDYQLLPVAVRVSWRSSGTSMRVELRTYLCER